MNVGFAVQQRLRAGKYYFVACFEEIECLDSAGYDFTRCIIASHSIEGYTHILLALLLAKLEGYPRIDITAILAGRMR